MSGLVSLMFIGVFLGGCAHTAYEISTARLRFTIWQNIFYIFVGGLTWVLLATTLWLMTGNW